MDFKISEYVEPSSSRRALSIAFKKARRRFPKDGLASKDDNHSSDTHIEDSSPESKQFDEPIKNCENHVKSVEVDQMESSLIDSLERVEISENADDTLCAGCQQQTDNLDYDDALVSEAKEEYRNICDRHLIDDDFDDSKNVSRSPCKIDQSRDISFYKDVDNYDSTLWKDERFLCENPRDSESEPARVYEIPASFAAYRETPTRRRGKQHRTKKRHSTSLDDEEPVLQLHSTSCPCFEQQQYCVHCHRHCCCYAVICCCCSRRCCSLYDFRHEEREERCKPSRRQQQQQQQRRSKRCSTCKRRVSSRHPDTDSGVFTNVPRYENDEDDVSCPLMHKDSLPILQEKYSERKRNDEEDESRRRKLRKRLVKYGNSY